MVGAFETVQKVASIEATHCSKQPTICYNSKHCAFDHFISRRAGCSKSKNSKRHVPGRERQSKAEEWLCPTNCGFLWCPLRCLTTLMITLRVSLLCSPSPNRRKTSATFSSVFFPRKQLSALPRHSQSFRFELFCPFACTQAHYLPWHKRVRSLDAYLTAFTCYHAVMDAWWFVSTDLAGNYFDLSCGEEKETKEEEKNK